MSSLQDIFNTVIINDESVAVPGLTRKQYESLRVSLLRKFAAYRKQCQAVGILSYDDRYVSFSFDVSTSTAAVQMRWKDESKRVPKDYKVLTL